MIGLWFFGNRTAALFGIRVYMLVYFAGGITAEIALISYRRHGISYGASLSVICLLGALIGAYGYRYTGLSQSARWKLAVLVVYGLLGTIRMPSIPRQETSGIP
jgi:membrane associated rhomboid family serine protease